MLVTVLLLLHSFLLLVVEAELAHAVLLPLGLLPELAHDSPVGLLDQVEAFCVVAAPRGGVRVVPLGQGDVLSADMILGGARIEVEGAEAVDEVGIGEDAASGRVTAVAAKQRLWTNHMYSTVVLIHRYAQM